MLGQALAGGHTPLLLSDGWLAAGGAVPGPGGALAGRALAEPGGALAGGALAGPGGAQAGPGDELVCRWEEQFEFVWQSVENSTW